MGAVIAIFISCARCSTTSACRNFLYFVWLSWISCLGAYTPPQAARAGDFKRLAGHQGALPRAALCGV